jgi:hypothetical protein
MDKFLFTDGTNGVREVQSQQELQTLIASAEHPDKVRIWLFSSNEWISYPVFRKHFPASNKRESTAVAITKALPAKKNRNRWLNKIIYITGAVAGIFLVVNFTKIKWEKAEPINISAARPDNAPEMNIDSLIWEIETSRGQALDRNTKNNLRLRNTWPDRIELKLHSEKETSSAGSRFFNAGISIDNSTGLNLDNAVVKLLVWKSSKVSITDTFRFITIRYDKLMTRQLDNIYRGDSISVSFESIKAKSFNFCYSATIKSNSGNYNDRWFCRE